MTRTEHYNLPVWDASDRVLRTDFNDMTEKIDAAMATVKSEAAAGVAEAKSANYLVKLGGPLVTEVDNGTLTFDLSGVDMSQYSALFLIMSAGAGSCTFSLAVNGTTLVTLATIDHGVGAGVAWVIPYGTNYLVGKSNYCTSASYGSDVGGYGTCPVAWTAITNLTLSGNTYAGATVTLYGIRA